MNIQILVGNLTREPEKINTQGTSLCKLVLAVNDNYTDKDGNRPVQYFDIVVWGKLADNCVKYLGKGSKVAVIGKAQTREWTTKEGEKRYAREVVATEIEFLNVKKGDKEVQAPEGVTQVNTDGLPF